MAVEGMSRRKFLSGAALAGAVVAGAGLVGCAPKSSSDAKGEADAAGTAGAAGGTVGFDGTGVMPWLGEAPASRPPAPQWRPARAWCAWKAPRS